MAFPRGHRKGDAGDRFVRQTERHKYSIWNHKSNLCFEHCEFKLMEFVRRVPIRAEAMKAGNERGIQPFVKKAEVSNLLCGAVSRGSPCLDSLP